jgi:hypothetical protein
VTLQMLGGDLQMERVPMDAVAECRRPPAPPAPRRPAPPPRAEHPGRGSRFVGQDSDIMDD